MKNIKHVVPPYKILWEHRYIPKTPALVFLASILGFLTEKQVREKVITSTMPYYFFYKVRNISKHSIKFAMITSSDLYQGGNT